MFHVIKTTNSLFESNQTSSNKTNQKFKHNSPTWVIAIFWPLYGVIIVMEAGGQPHKRSHLVNEATASASAILQADSPAIGRDSALFSRSQKNMFAHTPGTWRPFSGHMLLWTFVLSTWRLSGQLAMTTSPMHWALVRSWSIISTRSVYSSRLMSAMEERIRRCSSRIVQGTRDGSGGWCL